VTDSEGSTSFSADAETDVADGLPAEALFQFSQDFGLGNLFELAVQCRLQYSDVKDSLAQGDEPRDDVPQGRGYSVMTR